LIIVTDFFEAVTVKFTRLSVFSKWSLVITQAAPTLVCVTFFNIFMNACTTITGFTFWHHFSW